MRQYIHDITKENSNLNETLFGLLDNLSVPYFREKFFAIADALIGGRPIPTSSGDGCVTCLTFVGMERIPMKMSLAMVASA